MTRTNAWSSHGDDHTQTREPTEPPAVVALDPAGPPSIQHKVRDASIYLTRDNPATFITEESDARRLASTSRWVNVAAVGVEEIDEKFGAELIPSTYKARSDVEAETGPGPDIDPDVATKSTADDVQGVSGDATPGVEGLKTHSREELIEMDWPDLRSMAVESDHPGVNGQSSRDEIVEALSSGDIVEAGSGE